jgi:isopenicillin-N epimerase
MRDLFLLDPDVAFLNHGSFGACPRPVFDAYQNWQRHLETQPVRFIQREADDCLDEARQVIADYLHTRAETLHFVRNATVGVNYIARSIKLKPGEEVLTTTHEYGAMDATWQYVCDAQSAHYIKQPISLPYMTNDAFLEQLWAGVTPQTRVIFLSHITSPTAIRFPVEAVCKRARDEGILTVIDGAHAPGQIPLDLDQIGADYYTGNFHKWLCAPKSAGFMVTREEHQANWYPLVVSWGWINGETPIERLQWRGTDDVAAFLTVPDAIRFQEEHDWEQVRANCHALGVQYRAKMVSLFDHPPTSPDENFSQLFTVELPTCDPVAVYEALIQRYNIEVPLIDWEGRQFVRVSVQAYNTSEDLERLTNAIQLIFDRQS